MLKRNTKIHRYFGANIWRILLLFLMLAPLHEGYSNNFSYFSNILREQNIIFRDFTSDKAIKRHDALSIAVGIGGWPSGCGFINSISCDIETIARSRGLLFSRVENQNLNYISRANALKLILQAKGIMSSEKLSGYSDIDGKIIKNSAGYIARARELGCIQKSLLFRPFDGISEGEFAKIATCTIESDTPAFHAAPNTPNISSQYPSFSIDTNNLGAYGFIPSPSGSSSYALYSQFQSLETIVNNLLLLYSGSTGSTHPPVTLGLSGGLSLSGQILSLDVANAFRTGALSPNDWNTFNAKINLNSLSVTGGLLSYNSLTGIFGWSGTTSDITEGINLYFTDLRAQNALSGTVTTLSGRILSTEIATVLLSGSLNSISNTVFSLSGIVDDFMTDSLSLSGRALMSENAITSLSGNLNTTNTILGTTNTNFLTLSGVVANKISLTSLSGSNGVGYNNITGQFTDFFTFNNGLSRVGNTVGLISGLDGQTLTLSGGSAVWVNAGSVSVPVDTVFGRTGDILAMTGDYLSDQVTEGLTNLYFTDSRAQNALSGTISTLSGAVVTINTSIGTLSGQLIANTTDIASLSGSLFSLSGNLNITNSALSSLSGSLNVTNSIISSISGALSSLDITVSSLSGNLSSLSQVFSTLSGTVNQNSIAISFLSGSVNLTNTTLSNLSGSVSSLSGVVNTLSNQLSNLGTQVDTLSGSLLTANANILSISGAVNTLSGNLDYLSNIVSSLSGTIQTVITTVNTLSGSLATTNTNLSALSGVVLGNFNTLSGILANTNATVTSLSGVVVGLSNTLLSLSGTVAQNTIDIFTLSGGLSLTNTNLLSLSGMIANNTNDIATLSGNILSLSNSLTTATGNILSLSGTLFHLSGSLNTLSTNFLSLSGTVFSLSGSLDVTNSTISSLSGRLLITESTMASLSGNLNTTNSTLSSLSGTVVSLSGNLNTTNTNLATTNSYLSTATGNIITLSSAIASATGDILSLQNAFVTTNGSLATATGNILSLSGTVFNLSGTLMNLSGALSTLSNNFLSLSGVVATKISLTSLSGSNGVGYNNATGQFTDLFTFNSGLTRVGNTVGLVSGLDGQILTLSGGSAVWVNAGSVSVPVDTVFGRTGDILAMTGDYLSDQVTEGLTNLYFTDSRAQNALSGTISTLSGRLLTADGNINSLSGELNLANATILSLSGRILSTESTVDSLSGNLNLTNTNLITTNGYLATATGNILSVSNFLATATGDILSASGRISSVEALINSLSGYLDTTNINLSNLTVIVGSLSGNITSLSGNLNLTNTNLLSLSGVVNSLSGRLLSAEGNMSSLSGNLNTTNSNLTTTNTNLLSLSGTVFNLSGTVNTLSTTVNTLSGVVATKIGLTSLSANGPLTYNNLTGVFAIGIANSTTTGAITGVDWTTFNNKVSLISGPANGLSIVGSGISLELANSTTTGALSAFDWNTFNNKVASINGMTGVSQTFAIGTAGIDFNITSSGNVHTFNLPDASSTARGVVSTGSQTFTGAKTFDSTVIHNGATVMAAALLTNFTVSGAIGTASVTVDAKTTFNINQTTADITLTLPSPTNTSTGRILYINNIGTAGFTMLGQRVEAGQSRQAIWAGGNWRWIGDQSGESQIHIKKSADETVNNTIVLQNDDQLTFAIGANETWIGEILVDYTSPVAQDIRFALTAPAGATCVYSAMDFDEGTAGVANTPCATAIVMTTDSATDESALISFSVVNGGTAGSITLQWAQGVAAVVNTTVHNGSYLHAYRVRGADYAEVYYTDDGSVSKGDIVSLTGNGVSQVEKSYKPYDTKAIGIISTKPGMVVGEADGSGKGVIVGLAGRVPVKVSTKNGDIMSGDYITTSDIPGVGIKATEPGHTIGKALTSYAGKGVGTVMVFIENSYYDGVDDTEYNDYISASGNLTLSGGNALSIPSGSLDRFSFMVKKSLGKIGSGNIVFQNSGSEIGDISGMLSKLQNNIDSHNTQIGNLENSLTILSGSLEELRKGQVDLSSKAPEPAVTNITNNYTITNTGTESEYVKSIDEKNNLEVITDVIEYIKSLLVEGVRVIKEIIAIRIVAIEGQFEQIFAKYAHIDVIENQEITTKKLCIDGVNTTSCITESELRKLLEKNTPLQKPNTLPESVIPSNTGSKIPPETDTQTPSVDSQEKITEVTPTQIETETGTLGTIPDEGTQIPPEETASGLPPLSQEKTEENIPVESSLPEPTSTPPTFETGITDGYAP